MEENDIITALVLAMEDLQIGVINAQVKYRACDILDCDPCDLRITDQVIQAIMEYENRGVEI